jgi:TPR repeat protein
MYEAGKGVPQDDETAVKWYKLAAEQGLVEAQYNLGGMYDYGRGVPQDDETAVKWYRLAAEQGNVFAQYNLGLNYYKGQGVIQDNVYAHMWANISVTNGSETGGKLKDVVEEKMTASEIAEAQKLASEYLAKNYKDC